MCVQVWVVLGLPENIHRVVMVIIVNAAMQVNFVKNYPIKDLRAM